MITIQLFPETFLILFLGIFILSMFFYVRKKRKISIWFIGMIEIYILFIISVLILPIRIVKSDLIDTHFVMRNCFQLIPFQTIIQLFRNDTSILKQILGNIIFFIPMPIFIGFIKNNVKSRTLILSSIRYCLILEGLQVLLDVLTQVRNRVFDIDDIILNTIGIILGVSIYSLIKKVKPIYLWVCNYIVYSKNNEIEK